MQEFYTLYGDYLAGVCARYIVDEEDLKDVFQESLVHIFSRIADFEYRGEGSLRAWATKVTVNEALKHLRAARQQDFEQLTHDVAEVPEEDDPPISDIPPDVIHRLVSQLPTGYRTVFNLYVFEGRSHQEIARLLNIKERTSSSQLSRAKSLLAEMIRQYDNKKKSRQ